MAKSDFDLSDEKYDVVYDEKEHKGLFSKLKKSSKDKDDSQKEESSNSKGLTSDGGDIVKTKNNKNKKQTIENKSNEKNDTFDLGDFADVGSTQVFSDSDVVFEEKSNMTSSEKIKDYLSTINVRVMIVIVGIFLIIFVIVFMILLNVVKSNKAYSSDFIVPDVVYMGETSDAYVSTKYTGQGKAKKDINSTETSFEVANTKVLTVLEKKVKGSSVLNTIVPVQEGHTNIDVVSKLDGKVIGKTKKKVVVCPAFTPSLVQVKHVSVVKGSKYVLNTDFGESECSKNIVYSSSNENVATVSETGEVTGLEVGQSILTIKKGSKTISLTIDVTSNYVSVKTFKVIPTELQLSKGDKYRIKIDYYPVNATSFDVRYYSNDSSIVSVSDGGLIEALAPGSTTIRVVTPAYTFDTEISVVVKENSSGIFATNMSLDKSELQLVQGKSDKIQVTLTPSNVSNNAVSWNSSNENVASVTSDGVVYAKGVGNAVITASTDNGISRNVNVTVIKMKTPTITSSDAIASDNWHTFPYVLTLSGSENGAIYYYGNSIDQMNNVGDRIMVTADEYKTYYVKACSRVCTEVCSDKKNKKGKVQKDADGKPIKVCKSKCNNNPSVCSDPVSYISKYDRTKPVINAVVGIDDTPTKSDKVQISITDNMSLVQKWCVTTKNTYSSCRWKTIKTNFKPVVEYTAYSNGIYYVFAKDVAGNLSDSYQFEITNIE